MTVKDWLEDLEGWKSYRERERKRNRSWWANPHNLARQNARRRERYATDPTYRARVLKRKHTRHATPEYRERQRAWGRKRYATNPEFRERQRGRQATPEYRERERARWATPEKQAKVRAYRAKPETRKQVRKANRAWRTKPENRRLIMLWHAKKRAERKGIGFSLTPEWFAAEWKRVGGRCPACGVKMQHGKGKMTLQSPSLDLIDPHKAEGYSPTNAQLLCQRDNRRKSNNTETSLVIYLNLIRTRDWLG